MTDWLKGQLPRTGGTIVGMAVVQPDPGVPRFRVVPSHTLTLERGQALISAIESPARAELEAYRALRGLAAVWRARAISARRGWVCPV